MEGCGGGRGHLHPLNLVIEIIYGLTVDMQVQVFISRCQLNKLQGGHMQKKGEHQVSENFFLQRDRNYYGLDWEKICRDKSETKTSNYIYLHLIH